MRDGDFLKSMRIQPTTIPDPAPTAPGDAAGDVCCAGELVYMTREDLSRLIAANRSLHADAQAFAREAAAALAKAATSAKESRVWRDAFLLLAIGVTAVTVWGLVR